SHRFERETMNEAEDEPSHSMLRQRDRQVVRPQGVVEAVHPDKNLFAPGDSDGNALGSDATDQTAGAELGQRVADELIDTHVQVAAGGVDVADVDREGAT